MIKAQSALIDARRRRPSSIAPLAVPRDAVTLDDVCTAHRIRSSNEGRAHQIPLRGRPPAIQAGAAKTERTLVSAGRQLRSSGWCRVLAFRQGGRFR